MLLLTKSFVSLNLLYFKLISWIISYSSMTKNRIKDYFKPIKKNLHSLNNKGKIRLCLTHTPDMKLIAGLASRGADIVLCGHTHGGQIRLPKIGALISGCKIKTKYACGLFYFKNFILYITRGLGEGRYSPFRFYCHPEASLIRVYAIKK